MVSHMRPPALGRVRLASVEDAPSVVGIMTESMKMNFRVYESSDVVYLIENCVLSICHLDVNEAVVGFIAAKDYPLIPSVHPSAWKEYLWTKYKAVELNARNTLFLHLLCWSPVYGREVVDALLRSMFMHDPHLHHVAMVKALAAYPLLVAGNSRSEGSFRRVAGADSGAALCVADRAVVSPRLRIRRAVEEDNDDIVPILERHAPRLQQLYGEFYISELISRHPESERVLLVCEHKELAVGVMCLNTQINYEVLEENFDLSAFGGLRHVEQGTVHKSSREVQSGVSPTGLGNDLMLPSSQFVDLNGKPKEKVSFNEDELGDAATTPTPSEMAILDSFDLLEDENEEELEFDIVNIDNDLLRVPKIIRDSMDKGIVGIISKPLNAPSAVRDSDAGIERVPKKSSITGWDSVLSPENDLHECPHDPIRYTGPPNAFLLELFAMHPDYDERYGFDMLEVSYEVFHGRDYCIMCLPSNHPSFPLLEHFTLVTPYSAKTRFISETLYVAHVNSVRGNVSVRPGEAHDVNCLGSLLEHTPQPQMLIDLFVAALDSCQFSPFMLLSEKQPIGVVIVGPLTDDDNSIRAQYQLEPEPRRSRTDGSILLGVMSPALEPHGRWYMRDMLRQSHYTTLFWACRLFPKGDTKLDLNLMSLVGHMAPVRPRRSVPNISGNKDLNKVFKDLTSPFALWMLERPLTWLPKVYLNNSIVVVGASRTGLAFLETLIMGPTSQYLTFSNVTLVSEHGLPAVVDSLKAADTCVPREGRFTDRYLKSIPFYFYVDVMSAVMTNIDRKAKCIHLKGGGVKFYDELVLTCGEQFQHPDYLRESLELAREVENEPCDRILMDNPEYRPDRVPATPESPQNLMLINTVYEANNAMKKLLYLIKEAKDPKHSPCEENQVIVYGDCVEAYSCLAALLELGLNPTALAFIEPFPPEDATLRVNCFNNETVDERVQSSIEKLGIRVLRRCNLAGWRQVDSWIEAVHLMAPLHAITLPCSAFFYYGTKAIDINAFRATNESGLVYDGGLIVGPSFETNDPHVYGAGPCTRYSRRLYASRQQHRYHCSEDVGEVLARIFLRKFDPFVMCDSNTQKRADQLQRYSSSLLAFKDSHESIKEAKVNLGISRRWQSVTKFESPLVQYSTLPGPLYYLTVRRPGPLVPMEVQLSLPHQGHTLTTDKHGNYFQLQLNVLHCVDAVTCLSKEVFSPELLGQLYGKHEAFFNKLLARYKLGEVEDLYEFFTQPWMAALYQETFSDLLRDINDHDIGTVYDLMKARSSRQSSQHSTNDISKITCATESSCEMGHKNAQNLGTFRSVVDKFVARTYFVRNPKADIPSECGQSKFLRGEASAFWRCVGGEDIVSAHMVRHLARYSLTNPHYARPRSQDM